MVISCGNLPGELYHGRAVAAATTANYARMPLGYQIPASGAGQRERTREGGGRVGLDGGDITKMSENVTHLIIYAPRSRRFPRSLLPFSLSLSVPLALSFSPLSPPAPRRPTRAQQRELSATPLGTPLHHLGTIPSPATRSRRANPPAAASSPHSREKLIWPY